MMVNQVQTALQRLLEGQGLPVYAENRVPEGAGYPYLVWSCREAGFGETGSAQITCWFRKDYLGCVEQLDKLCALLPEQGMRLETKDGVALLWSEEAYVRTDAADTSVTGGCIRLGLCCYGVQDGEEAGLC